MAEVSGACDARFEPVRDALAEQLAVGNELGASIAPWWGPGSASGYHAQNQGHLVGELVRRTTGTTLREFVAREIAGPLEADFQIGAREQDWDRIAPVIPPPPLPIDLATLPPTARCSAPSPARPPMRRTPTRTAGAAPSWAR